MRVASNQAAPPNQPAESLSKDRRRSPAARSEPLAAERGAEPPYLDRDDRVALFRFMVLHRAIEDQLLLEGSGPIKRKAAKEAGAIINPNFLQTDLGGDRKRRLHCGSLRDEALRAVGRDPKASGPRKNLGA